MLQITVNVLTNTSAKILTFSNNFVFEGSENVQNTQKIKNFEILKLFKKDPISRFDFLINTIENNKF